MKTPAFFSMPWDTVVFLTITTVGFGFTLQQFRDPNANNVPVAQTLIQDASLADLGDESMVRHPAAQKPLDLGCLDEDSANPKLIIKDNSVRIKGRLCRLPHNGIRSIQGIRIKNLSNGYEGTVFLRESDNSFVSDYIILTNGKNDISVEWRPQLKPSEPRLFVAEVYEK